MSTLREKWHAGLNVWRTSGGLSAPSALLRFYRCATRCDAATTRAYLEGLVRNGLRITVFATGSFIEKNTDWALRMQGLGCEIGLHGYHHLSPNRMAPARFEADLKRCIAAFRRAGISFSGYRAPNLAMAPGCYPVLRRLGIAYSSSLLCSAARLDPMERCIAFMDVPLILHDPGPEEIAHTLRPHLLPGRVLCVHPYGFLGTRHGPVTRQLLLDCDLRTITIAEQLRGDEGLALSVDFGA